MCRCSGSSEKSTWKSASTSNARASRKTISTCLAASVSLYGQPPTRSAPIWSARRSSPSVPAALRMPSCANAQSCRSIAGAYSALSGSSASMPMSPTIGSTSTCVRIAVVPAATARSRTRRARAWMSLAVKCRFASPTSRIASATDAAPSGIRSERSALSRWTWASTSPGVTTRPPTSRTSPAGGGAPGSCVATAATRPPAIVRSRSPSRRGSRQPRSVRSLTSAVGGRAGARRSRGFLPGRADRSHARSGAPTAGASVPSSDRAAARAGPRPRASARSRRG